MFFDQKMEAFRGRTYDVGGGDSARMENNSPPIDKSLNASASGEIPRGAEA